MWTGHLWRIVSSWVIPVGGTFLKKYLRMCSHLIKLQPYEQTHGSCSDNVQLLKTIHSYILGNNAPCTPNLLAKCYKWIVTVLLQIHENWHHEIGIPLWVLIFGIWTPGKLKLIYIHMPTRKIHCECRHLHNHVCCWAILLFIKDEQRRANQYIWLARIPLFVCLPGLTTSLASKWPGYCSTSFHPLVIFRCY